MSTRRGGLSGNCSTWATTTPGWSCCVFRRGDRPTRLSTTAGTRRRDGLLHGRAVVRPWPDVRGDRRGAATAATGSTAAAGHSGGACGQREVGPVARQVRLRAAGPGGPPYGLPESQPESARLPALRAVDEIVPVGGGRSWFIYFAS